MIAEKIFGAWSGRKLYRRLMKKLGFTDTDYILFFPENKEDEVKAAVKSVPYYMEMKCCESVFCLWTEQAYEQPWIKSSIVLNKNESRHLLDFYDLYNFNRNLIIVSLRMPMGRLAYRLEGYKDLTLEDLYRYQVFNS